MTRGNHAKLSQGSRFSGLDFEHSGDWGHSVNQ